MLMLLLLLLSPLLLLLPPLALLSLTPLPPADIAATAPLVHGRRVPCGRRVPPGTHGSYCA